MSIDVHVGEVGVKNDDDIKDQSMLINEGVCKKKVGEGKFCKLKQRYDNYNWKICFLTLTSMTRS